MRLLIVALDAAHTSPGIVFKTLIRHLATFHDITLMAQGIDKDFIPDNVRVLPLWDGVQPWDKAEKNWRRFGFNPRDRFWSWKTWFKYRKALRQEKYDEVITLTSNGYYSALNLGKRLAEWLKCKYIIYTVDGMPSPLPWMGNDEKLHGNISKEMRRLCSGADLFISANALMMAYQQSIIPDLKGKWDYLYIPFRPIAEGYAQRPHEGYNILYAGSLYGLRRIDRLIAAFRRFLSIRPDAKLWFVGERGPGYTDCAPDLTTSGQVIFKDATDKIDEYYAIADCLLDLAADIPGDVFLSGKVICYLPYKLPILAISGEASPVSLIMGGVPSIVQCTNDTDEIAAALENIASTSFDFADRDALVHQFHPETNCQKFIKLITP
ncbi:MAG: hypothetical protein IJU13_06480 [Bacteroidales bacterium]|nr:hypothetical protein [Bacteroidales bacterium]